MKAGRIVRYAAARHSVVVLLGAALVLFAQSPVVAAIVYSQPPSAVFLRQSSQLGYDRFGSDYDQYVWDDFTLDTTQSITEIDWSGAYASGGYYGVIVDFVIGIYPSIAGGYQPDVINPPLVEYTVGGNAGETPPQPAGQITQSFHDYQFVLPTPFLATAGTKYWVQIEGIQPGPTDWGLTAATSGNGGIFFAQAGVGDFQYFAGPGNVGFTLIGPGTPGNTVTPTSTLPAPSATPTATATPNSTVASSPTATVSSGTTLVSAKRLLVRDDPANATRRKVIFVSTDAGIDLTLGAGFDPVANGAALQVYNANGSGEAVCLPLPSTGWSMSGTAPKLSYSYHDSSFTYGPCKTASVKDGKLIKIACLAKVKPIAYSLNEPSQGVMGVRFVSGGTTWCAVFGGQVVKDSGTDPPVAGGKGQFKAKYALAPTQCPAAPGGCP